MVTVDVPSLDFGLIELGESASLSLKLSNYSNALLHYKFNQIVVLSEDNKDGALLPFVVSTQYCSVYMYCIKSHSWYRIMNV